MSSLHHPKDFCQKDFCQVRIINPDAECIDPFWSSSRVHYGSGSPEGVMFGDGVENGNESGFGDSFGDGALSYCDGISHYYLGFGFGCGDNYENGFGEDKHWRLNDQYVHCNRGEGYPPIIHLNEHSFTDIINLF